MNEIVHEARFRQVCQLLSSLIVARVTSELLANV